MQAVAYCRVSPLARPRTDLNHIYQPKENQRALYEELWNYTPLMASPIDYPVIVDMTICFVKSNAAANEYPTGTCHGDEDNLRKAINDALVHCKIIKDDRFVIGGQTFKIYAPENQASIKIWSIRPSTRKELSK